MRLPPSGLLNEISLDNAQELLRHIVDVCDVHEVLPELTFNIMTIAADTGGDHDTFIFVHVTDNTVNGPFSVLVKSPVSHLIVCALSIGDNNE